ncbi:hypothetical protein FACS189468_7680 [Spirochaetia bacterium]|nr:hypothetical protein FACS189468_7680 [Spirochaetia bacterium]
MAVVKKDIGYYNETTGEYIRDFSGQGWHYKDGEAFGNKTDEVCYIPELSDEHYTYVDFLRISKGNKAILEYLFDTVDWQSPETLFNDLLISEGIGEKG